MSYRLVDSDAALAATLAALPAAADLAVDTEFMRRDTFYPQVALLQLYAGAEVYLIDPLAVSDTDALAALLTDPARLKVLHSGSEDLEVFSHWLGVLPAPIVDTQRAAALLGEDFGLGYRALVERLLGITLDKGETRSDWLQRPLSDSQCHYAAQDVEHLLPVWKILRQRALDRGRLDWVLEESRELGASMLDREREPYRRLKGAGRLSRRQLAVLAALYDWRENRARSSDKPRGWILNDKACLAIAQSLPGDRDALQALDALPGAVLRRHSAALLDLVEHVAGLSDDALPGAFPAPLPAAGRQALKELKAQVRERAEQLGVAPEILLPAADLELLVREAAGEAIAEPRRWRGWRSDAVIEPLRRLAA